MQKKIHSKKKAQKNRVSEATKGAGMILRTVSNEEAFYFYEDLNKPTGDCARSLSEFCEELGSVKLESLVFHLQRKDFQNWIRKVLGDAKLAEKISRIRPLCDETTRLNIRNVVESRVKELMDTSVTLLVAEGIAVTA